MLKLIPHIAEGSWVIRQSIGTTPAILGKALKTTYHVNDRYMEASAFATLPGGNTGVPSTGYSAVCCFFREEA